MNKQTIARHFGKAIQTYDQEALIQQYIAEKMVRLIRLKLPESCSRIVEFGCGTGGYSRLLFRNFQPEHLTLNDLCADMKSCLHDLPQSQVTFLSGDAETIGFPDGLDLITSCSALQWFHDPRRFFRICHRNLSENGSLSFSTFGPQNLTEIKQLTGRGLSYLSLSELVEMLSPEYTILHAEEELLPRYFSSPMEILRHLKRTGTTASEGPPMTRNELLRFSEEYVYRFSCNHRVKLTYHPLYIVARKKAFSPTGNDSAVPSADKRTL